ncbi:hypothetical protein B5S31_g5347 [[Candida] boidinii]|nr:hypothetical protein B5S31_g5347 [[Candida] boidinii]
MNLDIPILERSKFTRKNLIKDGNFNNDEIFDNSITINDFKTKDLILNQSNKLNNFNNIINNNNNNDDDEDELSSLPSSTIIHSQFKDKNLNLKENINNSIHNTIDFKDIIHKVSNKNDFQEVGEEEDIRSMDYDDDDDDDDDLESPISDYASDNLLPSPPSSPPRDLDPGKLYALFDFSGPEDSHLELTKDDPVELLNDSDSYWWLVRKLNGLNSVGFAPAEILETYEERLARLNCWKNEAIEKDLNYLSAEDIKEFEKNAKSRFNNITNSLTNLKNKQQQQQQQQEQNSLSTLSDHNNMENSNSNIYSNKSINGSSSLILNNSSSTTSLIRKSSLKKSINTMNKKKVKFKPESFENIREISNYNLHSKLNDDLNDLEDDDERSEVLSDIVAPSSLIVNKKLNKKLFMIKNLDDYIEEEEEEEEEEDKESIKDEDEEFEKFDRQFDDYDNDKINQHNNNKSSSGTITGSKFINNLYQDEYDDDQLNSQLINKNSNIIQRELTPFIAPNANFMKTNDSIGTYSPDSSDFSAQPSSQESTPNMNNNYNDNDEFQQQSPNIDDKDNKNNNNSNNRNSFQKRREKFLRQKQEKLKKLENKKSNIPLSNKTFDIASSMKLLDDIINTGNDFHINSMIDINNNNINNNINNNDQDSIKEKNINNKLDYNLVSISTDKLLDQSIVPDEIDDNLQNDKSIEDNEEEEEEEDSPYNVNNYTESSLFDYYNKSNNAINNNTSNITTTTTTSNKRIANGGNSVEFNSDLDNDDDDDDDDDETQVIRNSTNPSSNSNLNSPETKITSIDPIRTIATTSSNYSPTPMKKLIPGSIISSSSIGLNTLHSTLSATSLISPSQQVSQAYIDSQESELEDHSNNDKDIKDSQNNNNVNDIDDDDDDDDDADDEGGCCTDADATNQSLSTTNTSSMNLHRPVHPITSELFDPLFNQLTELEQMFKEISFH